MGGQFLAENGRIALVLVYAQAQQEHVHRMGKMVALLHGQRRRAFLIPAHPIQKPQKAGRPALHLAAVAFEEGAVHGVGCVLGRKPQEAQRRLLDQRAVVLPGFLVDLQDERIKKLRNVVPYTVHRFHSSGRFFSIAIIYHGAGDGNPRLENSAFPRRCAAGNGAAQAACVRSLYRLYRRAAARRRFLRSPRRAHAGRGRRGMRAPGTAMQGAPRGLPPRKPAAFSYPGGCNHSDGIHPFRACTRAAPGRRRARARSG